MQVTVLPQTVNQPYNVCNRCPLASAIKSQYPFVQEAEVGSEGNPFVILTINGVKHTTSFDKAQWNVRELIKLNTGVLTEVVVDIPYN